MVPFHGLLHHVGVRDPLQIVLNYQFIIRISLISRRVSTVKACSYWPVGRQLSLHAAANHSSSSVLWKLKNTRYSSLVFSATNSTIRSHYVKKDPG